MVFLKLKADVTVFLLHRAYLSDYALKVRRL